MFPCKGKGIIINTKEQGKREELQSTMIGNDDLDSHVLGVGCLSELLPISGEELFSQPLHPS